MRLGPMELGLIVVLVLILFGAGRLPDVFSQLGKAVKNFKDGQKDDPTDVGSDRPRLSEDVEDAELADKDKQKDKDKAPVEEKKRAS
jgi:sec-independent protein translocase protein TatA